MLKLTKKICQYHQLTLFVFLIDNNNHYLNLIGACTFHVKTFPWNVKLFFFLGTHPLTMAWFKRLNVSFKIAKNTSNSDHQHGPWCLIMLLSPSRIMISAAVNRDRLVFGLGWMSEKKTNEWMEQTYVVCLRHEFLRGGIFSVRSVVPGSGTTSQDGKGKQ